MFRNSNLLLLTWNCCITQKCHYNSTQMVGHFNELVELIQDIKEMPAKLQIAILIGSEEVKSGLHWKTGWQKCFQGRVYFLFLLSLSLFLLSRGLEKRFGREGEGWFQAPCIPQSTVTGGGSFLPRQPAVTFCEQQEPGLFQAVSLGWGFCLNSKKKLEKFPLFLHSLCPSVLSCLLAVMGKQWSWCSQELLV